MANMIVDFKTSKLESAIVRAPFNKATSILKKRGYQQISLEQDAKLRMLQESLYSKHGNLVREAVLYNLKEKPRMVRNPPTLYLSSEAVQPHKESSEFYLTDKQIEQARADSIELPEGEFWIPTNRLVDDEITNWMFGENNKNFGNFLRDKGIMGLPIWVLDKNYVMMNVSAHPEIKRPHSQQKAFIRPVWFADLPRCNSYIFCNYFGLSDNFWARGIRTI